jgi:hypothetical protein
MSLLELKTLLPSFVESISRRGEKKEKNFSDVLLLKKSIILQKNK